MAILYGPTFADEMFAAGLLPGATVMWTVDTIDRRYLTPEQNTLLDTIIAAHDPTKQRAPIIPTSEFIVMFTDSEYLALKQTLQNDTTGGPSRSWDSVTSNMHIDFNSSEVKTLMTGLVSSGVLSQSRSDEIARST